MTDHEARTFVKAHLRPERWRLHWRSKTTGKAGKGAGLVSKVDADSWVKRDNAMHPDLEHWAEEEPNE